jgi:hypothetical protein
MYITQKLTHENVRYDGYNRCELTEALGRMGMGQNEPATATKLIFDLVLVYMKRQGLSGDDFYEVSVYLKAKRLILRTFLPHLLIGL